MRRGIQFEHFSSASQLSVQAPHVARPEPWLERASVIAELLLNCISSKVHVRELHTFFIENWFFLCPIVLSAVKNQSATRFLGIDRVPTRMHRKVVRAAVHQSWSANTISLLADERHIGRTGT